jgi:molybdopterin-guanine dinucleotide biosynthesis protein A
VGNNTPGIYGPVLAGGRSSRMGRDKSTIVVHGKSQKDYLLEELGTVCEKVFTSAKQPSSNVIVDAFSIESPLNGILSALQFSPNYAWLVVAVDMPFVDRKVLQYLTAARDSTRVATCFHNKETQLPEPLLSIWEPAAFPLLKKFVEDGQISPRDFLARNNVRTIDPPDPKIFYNMNRPEDLV